MMMTTTRAAAAVRQLVGETPEQHGLRRSKKLLNFSTPTNYSSSRDSRLSQHQFCFLHEKLDFSARRNSLALVINTLVLVLRDSLCFHLDFHFLLSWPTLDFFFFVTISSPNFHYFQQDRTYFVAVSLWLSLTASSAMPYFSLQQLRRLFRFVRWIVGWVTSVIGSMNNVDCEHLGASERLLTFGTPLGGPTGIDCTLIELHQPR